MGLRKGNDRVLFTSELVLVGSVEHATYSSLFAMAGYCIVLPVRIGGKGSGESRSMCPHSNLTFVMSRTERVSSISECNVGGRPDGKRMNGESSFGFSRNRRVVYFTKAEKASCCSIVQYVDEDELQPYVTACLVMCNIVELC